ncbi:putative secreted protein (Por secretion system target) [Winogradskyella eximia]|uniref:Putative secreted protein (Por secretion system target) n=1 Tax=Winogradskyella eximia TaxID=262006 RepID=A0A3D9HCC2_9FLAO|nr:T9SS type A sorting domain-containing protein [Winogradskyella eximia]RED46676.1 putative secreted protein (Por secretion system target) [Winogradskyella eximia]
MKKIYFLLFALLIASFSFGQDLLVNGAFEAWDDSTTPTGWTKAENVEQEATEVHSGTYSAKHTGGTSDIAQTITGITPGTSYTVSVWYKVDAGFGDNTDARIWSKWALDGVNDNTTDADVLQGVGTTGYFDNNGNVWTLYTTTVTAPATANEFYFEVRTYGSAVVYWDDFSFVQQAGAVPTLGVTSPSNGETIASPDVNVEISVQNFTVAAGGTGDGYITYSVDAGSSVDKFDTTPIALTGLADGAHTIDLELVDNSGTSLSPAATASVSFTVTSVAQVSNIAALRAGTEGQFYQLTGEALLTYQQSFRNQKFIEDATGAILIDDTAGNITSSFAIGDGMTGLTGELGSFGGMMQFIPSADPGAASSTGNTLTPQAVTLAELTANAEAYESELVIVSGVTMDNTTPNFNGGSEHSMSQGGDMFTFRSTFYDADYADQQAAVPTAVTDIAGIVNERTGNLYFLTARDASDFSVDVLSVSAFETAKFSLYPNPTSTGSVSISSTNSEAISVQVFDILGKQVKNETITNNTLNVSNLKSGVYIVKITQNNASTTKKLVIK